jgi:hypothetical protein
VPRDGLPVTLGVAYPFSYGAVSVEDIDVTTPAAGANASWSVEGRFWARIVSARATLTTDANAANRLMALDFIDGRGVLRIRNAPSSVATANTTAQAFQWKPELGMTDLATNTEVGVPLSPRILPPGSSVQFTVVNKQVADQLTLLTLSVEKFPTGERGEPLGVVGLHGPAAVPVGP